ncbi:MAG: IclR family transcriptional regulator [Clostridiales bacterium]|nr:IclR family transcriptional regulator [Clostridiales bacterium]
MESLSERKTNQSVEKVFTIIETLAEAGEPMRIQDIAAALSMSTSTVFRFLTTLTKCGYISQNPETSKYYLTFKICSIANKLDLNSSMRDIARPFLRTLSKIFEESVCIAIEQDMSMVYLDVIEGQGQILRTMQRIGNIAPMHCTGVGKLFLTEYSPSKLNKLISSKGLTSFTQNTFTNKEDLLTELQNVKNLGYAYDNEECEIGARCIAAPIRAYDGRIIAGISVTGPSFRMTDERLNKNLPHLLGTAELISKALGY